MIIRLLVMIKTCNVCWVAGYHKYLLLCIVNSGVHLMLAMAVHKNSACGSRPFRNILVHPECTHGCAHTCTHIHMHMNAHTQMHVYIHNYVYL